MEAKLDMMLEKLNTLEDIKTEVTQIRCDLQNFKHDLSIHENKITVLEDKVLSQSKTIQYLERQARCRNLILIGLPENNADINALLDSVIGLFNNKLKLEIQTSDIHNIYRIGKNGVNGVKPRPVLITLSSILLKNNIFHKRRLLKGTGIFINYDLSKNERENRRTQTKQTTQNSSIENTTLNNVAPTTTITHQTDNTSNNESNAKTPGTNYLPKTRQRGTDKNLKLQNLTRETTATRTL